MMVAFIMQLLVVGCCLVVNVLMVGLALGMRYLPELLSFTRRTLRWWLVISFRFYRFLLTGLTRLSGPWLPVNWLATAPRMAASAILSLSFGLGLLTLAGLRVSVWLVLLFVTHGLLVGGLWDELTEPGGIRLGERVS
jgi:hypothetical protein